jgi:hypothetical protein
VTSSSPQKPNIDDTFAEDDFFDLDKYKKAAQVAFDFSIGKRQEEGRQTRENIGKTGFEQRETNKQQQEFRDRDEARDSRQSQKAYRF